MKKSSKLYFLGFAACLSLLGVAYFYFQQHLGLAPCPLCMLQRAVLVGIAVLCLLAWLHQPRQLGGKVYAVLVGLLSVLGLGVAGRQVWLQHLPADKVPECGLNPVFRWMDSEGSYSFIDMLLTTFKGSGDCAEVDWTFLGLGIAAWMIVVFIVFLLVAIQQFKRQKRFFS